MTRKLNDRSKNIARIFWFISRSLFGMCRAQTVYRVQENVLASIRNNLKPQITINPARPRPDLNSSLYHRAWIYLNTITSGELSLIRPNREFPSRKINDFVPVPRSQDLSWWNRFLRTIDVQLEIQIFEPKFYSRLKQFYDSFFIPDGYMKLYDRWLFCQIRRVIERELKTRSMKKKKKKTRSRGNCESGRSKNETEVSRDLSTIIYKRS